MRPNELIIHLFQRFCWLDEGLQTRLHDRGWPDVSRSQSMVMINIVSGVDRPSEIARRLGVSRQAIHTTILQMVGLGIVELQDDPCDGRYKRVVVTEFGDRMRHDAQQAMDALGDAVAKALGRDLFESLLKALEADWGPASRNKQRN